MQFKDYQKEFYKERTGKNDFPEEIRNLTMMLDNEFLTWLICKLNNSIVELTTVLKDKGHAV